MFFKEGNDVYIDNDAKPKNLKRNSFDQADLNCGCDSDFTLLGYDYDISVIKCTGCGKKSYIP